MKRVFQLGLVVLLVFTSFFGVINLIIENTQGTDVIGTISDDTTWNLVGSPYIIVGNITVHDGATLTINPGVEVKFDGFYSMNVNGTLMAIGTAANRINITSNRLLPWYSDWNQINIGVSGHAEIRYTDIHYGECGIRLQSSGNVISNSIISRNGRSLDGRGIWIESSSDNIIENNVISYNGFYGVLLKFSSSNNYIRHNHFFSNDDHAILLRASSNNKIENNYIRYNGHGIRIDSGSQYNDVKNNEIHDELYGISVDWSFNNITNNNVTGSANFGIYVTGSSNYISNNFFIDNGNYGIHITGSSNIVTNNYISDSLYGLKTDGALNNRIFHNNIVGNINQAYDTTYNIWNDTYPSGGNYWSDYSPTCQDLYDGPVTPQSGGGGPDGICDDKYDINVGLKISDYYPLTAPTDMTPPIITNLQPLNNAVIDDDAPIIGAEYSDASGINIGSVMLRFDDMDVTSSATVTLSGVTYTPPTALPEGSYDVYLEVSDIYGNQAIAVWTFTIDMTGPSETDTTPPTISNLRPFNESTISDSTPTIAANFSDTSGINVSNVILKVDDVDVISSATITTNGVTYTPATPLDDGLHAVHLEVKDNSTNQNKAAKSWTFTIDTSTSSVTPQSDSRSEYWWILAIIVIVEMVFILVLFLAMRKKSEIVPPPQQPPLEGS